MANQDLTSDQRFNRVTKDPRFWEMPEKQKKIKIDKRFQAMFHDKKFNLKYTVDKRGRPMIHNTKEDLKRYYDLSDSDEDVTAEEETAVDTKKEKKKVKPKQKDEAKSKETAPKIIKERKEEKTSEKMTKKKEEKNLKTKENNLSKQIIDEKIKTKEKPSTSVSLKSTKKSKSVMEQEESEEESGLEDESDQYSNDQPSSGEEMSGMEIEEDEESDDESEDDDDDAGGAESTEEDEGDSSEEDEDSDVGQDLARGKGNIETSSEEEDDDDEEDLARKETEIEHSWRELDKDAPRGDEVTRRLAVCNMDWDRLNAKDLLALFNSFKPKGGIVFSVKIYPSEFGKDRLKEEELHGPTDLQNIPEDIEEDKWIYKEKLREYQFKRLKYFYAVVECDSPETAGKIYEECDGLEFETSCSFLDLRFIPDDVQFDDEPKDSAVDVDLSAYKPKLFTSAAMVTSKVEITWDETDQERVTILNRPFKKNDVLDMDFQAYLASSSEEEEEEEEQTAQESEVSAKADDAKSKKGSKDDDEQIERYRQLLKGIQEKEKRQQDKDVEMEIKWVPGLKESAEQMVKNKLKEKEKLTPWEQYLEKQKDKRKLKRKKKQENVEESNDEDDVPSDVDFNDPFFAEELKGLQKKPSGGKKQEDQESSADEEEKHRAEMALLMMDDVEEDRKHFNYDEIVEQQNLSRSKKKKLQKKDKLVKDDFEINVEDSRFQAMYTSHLYNVDPSDPHFKKTKAMEKVLEEKARRRKEEQKSYTETVNRQQQELDAGEKTGTSTKKVADPALSALLKSIKSKTEQHQASKKQKTK